MRIIKKCAKKKRKIKILILDFFNTYLQGINKDEKLKKWKKEKKRKVVVGRY